MSKRARTPHAVDRAAFDGLNQGLAFQQGNMGLAATAAFAGAPQQLAPAAAPAYAAASEDEDEDDQDEDSSTDEEEEERPRKKGPAKSKKQATPKKGSKKQQEKKKQGSGIRIGAKKAMKVYSLDENDLAQMKDFKYTNNAFFGECGQGGRDQVLLLLVGR